MREKRKGHFCPSVSTATPSTTTSSSNVQWRGCWRAPHSICSHCRKQLWYWMLRKKGKWSGWGCGLTAFRQHPVSQSHLCHLVARGGNTRAPAFSNGHRREAAVGMMLDNKERCKFSTLVGKWTIPTCTIDGKVHIWGLGGRNWRWVSSFGGIQVVVWHVPFYLYPATLLLAKTQGS